jgi:steroid 5-alpha reductase family enzyme
VTAPAQSLLAWVGGALWCVLALVWLRGLGPLTKVHWMHRLHALAPVACLAGLVMLTPGTALRDLLGDWLFTGLFVLALLTPVWLWTVRRRNSSVMDVVYSLAALVPAGLEAVRQPALSPANWLMLLLMLVWSARLVRHASGTNLGARGEQQPYASWRVQFGRRWWWWSYFQVFLLQGGLVWVWLLPVVLALNAPARPFSPTDGLATLVWLVGFGFQAGADWQLARFKADPANRGRVMRTGLWSLSRHPNYFGETLMWCALFLFGLAHPLGWLGLAGPLYVGWFMSVGSASAMLDRHMLRTKPEYADYVRQVPGFCPFWKSSRDEALLAWAAERAQRQDRRTDAGH